MSSSDDASSYATSIQVVAECNFHKNSSHSGRSAVSGLVQTVLQYLSARTIEPDVVAPLKQRV